MRLRLHLLSLSLVWLAMPKTFAQSADDFFHNGAVNYLSNNIPKALEVVTNGRATFPDDIKLKKLEELLKQQNQQQQQNEQQKQDEKKNQQSKQDQKDEKKQEQQKEDQQKQDQQQQAKSQPQDKKQDQQQQIAAHAMTPEEAKQLLDAQKGDEKVLQFVPQEEQKKRSRPLKDW